MSDHVLTKALSLLVLIEVAVIGKSSVQDAFLLLIVFSSKNWTACFTSVQPVHQHELSRHKFK